VKSALTILIIYASCLLRVYGQNDEGLFTRLQAIENNGTIFYNVDGLKITSHHLSTEFSKENICRSYTYAQISENELVRDDLLNVNNFKYTRTLEKGGGPPEVSTCYFVEVEDKRTLVITFGALKPSDSEFERKFVSLVKNDLIPEYVFVSPRTDVVNFAGRNIYLDIDCRWMGVNNLQCPYAGRSVGVYTAPGWMRLKQAMFKQFPFRKVQAWYCPIRLFLSFSKG